MSAKLFKIDYTSGEYVIKRGQVEERRRYRSERVAWIVAEIHRRLGWRVAYVNHPPKLAGAYPRHKAMTEVWMRVLGDIEAGRTPKGLQAKTVELLRACGLVEDVGAGAVEVTQAGEAWMQNPRERLFGDGEELKKKMNGNGKGAKVVKADDVREMLQRARALEFELKRLQDEIQANANCLPEEVQFDELFYFFKLKRGDKSRLEIAKEIGYSSDVVSRFENGENVTIQTFIKICRWMGVKKIVVGGGHEGA